jgi:hypothetical protein
VPACVFFRDAWPAAAAAPVLAAADGLAADGFAAGGFAAGGFAAGGLAADGLAGAVFAAGGLAAGGFAAGGFVAGGFVAAEPVAADGPVAPPGLAGADDFVAPGDFGATDLAEVALLTADGLTGAGRAGVAVAVPTSAGAAPGTGAG